jgi:hypothetical protein
MDGGKTMDSSIKGPIITGVFAVLVAVIGYILATQPINPLVNEPPVITNLVPNLPSPHAEGTPITWTAIASDPDDDTLLYKFQLCGPSTGNRYMDQQNWSQKNEWIWNSGPSDIGTNVIRVLVKDLKHEQSYFRNYSITRDELGQILHSEYTKMNISETYPFMACVALNDSIETAQSEIRTFTHAIDKAPIISNDSIETVKRESETAPNIAKTPMNISTDMSVDLKELTPGTFSIHLISPESETQKIPQDDPRHNYATWIWDVTPTRIGTNDLILSAYDAEGHNRKARISIAVTVKQASTEETPVVDTHLVESVIANSIVDNETKETEEPPETANVTTNETLVEPVMPPVEEKKNETPGFESIFAITGLLAVAYLVRGRRE